MLVVPDRELGALLGVEVGEEHVEEAGVEDRDDDGESHDLEEEEDAEEDEDDAGSGPMKGFVEFILVLERSVGEVG